MVSEHVGLHGVHIGGPLLADGAVDGVALLVLAVDVPPHLGLSVRDVRAGGTHEHTAPLLVGHFYDVFAISFGKLEQDACSKDKVFSFTFILSVKNT